ncbi:MAG: SRPBCC family protein [Acidimicrobiia bacterium]|nr:SRPBCC family protein [Acidimicrobiia bacterium]
MSVTVSVDLDAPIDEVWADVARLGTHVDWMADAESITFATHQESGVGTVMEVLTKVGPLSTRDIIEITEWEEQKLIGVEHRGVVRGTGRFVLEPIDAGRTRFTWNEDLDMPWYFGGKLGSPISDRALEMIWRRNLRRLQARFV